MKAKSTLANFWTGLGLATFILFTATAIPSQARSAATDDYDELVRLFQAFVDWQAAQESELELTDYSREAVDRRIARVQEFQRRLAAIDVGGWTRSQQVDYLAARAKLDEEEFVLRVHRPWSRDPGFYVDRIRDVAFTELPVTGAERETLVTRLESVRALVDNATKNLRDVPADLADRALHNLSNADGVGGSQPYRKVPPEGVLGWYDDLLGRARRAQPELVPDIEEARAAVEEFADWLAEKRPGMTAPAGIGEELLDWYLLHVKYMPYSSDDIVVLAQREIERLSAFIALERHSWRDLPELTLPSSAEEYGERLASIDADIRKFLVEENFITIPDYMPEDYEVIRAPVPWIIRPEGPNYWEAIQYRDPAPDHWHATIPGHGFDGQIRSRITHPIRRHIRDGGRAEGWGVYLEEAPLQLGFYDTDRQRTRELIYNFGLFRAVRTIGDVWLQRNEKDTAEVVEYWMSRTPYLDENVARVDAEIYLRRPPGYGLGYTIGAIQVFKLLADRKRQLGGGFVLRDFHDEFINSGWVPISLIRYEMTGLEDEVSRFRNRTPLSSVLDD